jgi:hypothetical protein
MFKIAAISILAVLFCGKAWALDEFDGVKCGTDIQKALIGKRSTNDRVVATEARHKDLGLKNLGGDEVSDNLSLESWLVCGSEFELLVNTKGGLIRDVLPFPSHSKSSPMVLGGCQMNGREMPETVMAILDNRAGYNARDQAKAKTLLKATAAWKIDEAHARFEAQPTAGLSCALGGVVTVDGGP